MKKILVGIVLVVLVLVLGVVAVAMTKPTHYHIVRSATLASAPEHVFPLIDDLHAFPSWSPWQKLDPAMQMTYTGAERGTGAIVEWKGNKDAGEGRMTITESVPNEHIGMKLEFIKPFASTATTGFQLTPEGAGTKVEWSMDGDNDFFSKIMCVFMDMDAMVGKDFVEGLANLDRVSREAAAAPAASADSTSAPAPDSTAAATH